MLEVLKGWLHAKISKRLIGALSSTRLLLPRSVVSKPPFYALLFVRASVLVSVVLIEPVAGGRQSKATWHGSDVGRLHSRDGLPEGGQWDGVTPCSLPAG